MKNWQNKIENLVTLKADIAFLQKQAKAIEEDFKAYGVDVWDGTLHTLKVTKVDSWPVDWKGLCEDFKPSEYYIKKHTGYKSGLRLTINVKKKEAA